MTLKLERRCRKADHGCPDTLNQIALAYFWALKKRTGRNPHPKAAKTNEKSRGISRRAASVQKDAPVAPLPGVVQITDIQDR
jgi:hypothetical protein